MRPPSADGFDGLLKYKYDWDAEWINAALSGFSPVSGIMNWIVEKKSAGYFVFLLYKVKDSRDTVLL